MSRRYRNTEVLKSEDGKRYYGNVIYPDIPLSEDDIYVITTGSDRYDTLAQQFYGDSSYWWIIAFSNTLRMDGLTVEQGVQLRIPTSVEKVLVAFEELNNRR